MHHTFLWSLAHFLIFMVLMGGCVSQWSLSRDTRSTLHKVPNIFSRECINGAWATTPMTALITSQICLFKQWHSSLASFTCFFHLIVHFAVDLVLSTTWNDLLCGWQEYFAILFFFSSPNCWYQFDSGVVGTYFASRMTWNYVEITEDNIHSFVDVFPAWATDCLLLTVTNFLSCTLWNNFLLFLFRILPRRPLGR